MTTPKRSYLVRKQQSPDSAAHARAHIWTGGDTLCRMFGAGSLSLKNYVIVDSPLGVQVCRNCEAMADKGVRL